MQEVFEKIIDQLKAESIIVDDEAGNRAVEIIEQAAAEYNNGWIPCNKGLPPQPEENPMFDYKPLELYLVSVKGTDYPFRAFWNGKFFTDGWNKADVIAWQPLPESYQHQPEGERQHKQPTNADRIRSMSDEELAHLIAEKIECTECPFNGSEEKCGNIGCSKLFLEWLQSEAEVES